MIKRAIALSTIFLLGLTSTSFAQTKQQLNEPILLHADELNFDKESNIITATGNVEVFQEKEVLTADNLSYNRNLDQITATGNVVWQRETGDVFFGSYTELKDRMKDGIIREFRGLLIDESRLAANLGKRKNGNETQMDQAVYSPCKVCKDTPDKAPLWQIKSETALWDEENHDIIYTDAWMELFGIPVLYTPYLRHPDPSVKQRSGILAPLISTSKDLGFYFTLPYYYVISPDKDITLTPLITSKKGQFLSAEYRQRFGNADLEIGGSYGYSEKLVKNRSAGVVTNKEKDVWRGHLDSTVNWDLNENWRVKAHALRSTDRTYLRQFPFYGYTHENVLTSKAKAEGFYGLNYARIQAYIYQVQRTMDQQKRIPKVAPVMDFNYVSPQQFWDSRFYVDANTLVISRTEGTNVQRISSTASWKVPFVSGLGDKYALSFRMRGDGYNRNDYRPRPGQDKESGGIGRAFPQGFLEWEYPWIKTHGSGHFIISPMASLVVAPKIGNQTDAPNEDCDYVEPNDEYLLNYTRFPGLDRIDDGSRVNYAMKVDTRFSKDLKGGAFVGQTVSFNKPNRAFAGTGFDKKSSDYFGRINFTLYDLFDARYRFRLDRSNFNLTRNEVQTSFGVPIFKINVDYLKLPPFSGANNSTSGNQITLGISSNFAKGWTASIRTVRNLGKLQRSPDNCSGNNPARSCKASRTLENVGNIGFENECISLGLQLSQTYYRSGDIKPDKGFMFVIGFKTLGGQTLHQIKYKKAFNENQKDERQAGGF